PLPPPLGLALNALHVAAMALWIGGLAGFVVAPAGGFARVAAISAGLLVVSGAALALLHFGSMRQMMTTTYGDGLLIKLPLVAAALYLARLGRHRGELAALMAVL